MNEIYFLIKNKIDKKFKKIKLIIDVYTTVYEQKRMNRKFGIDSYDFGFIKYIANFEAFCGSIEIYPEYNTFIDFV